MKAPPLLPEETYFRVLRAATVDGISVMAVAGLLALAAAAVRDFPNAGIGLLVAAAGAIELHGAGLVRAGDARGMNWMIASQPFLMLVLLGYCAMRLYSPDFGPVNAALDAGLPAQSAEQRAMAEDLARSLYTPMYVALAIGTVLFQGGMAVYYWRRRAAVTAALEGEPEDESAA